MKIIFSSIGGNNKTEANHYRRVLHRLGHDLCWIPSANTVYDSEHGRIPEPGFVPGMTVEDLLHFAGKDNDLFLYVEHTGIIPEGMERAPFTTACVLCDVHNYLSVRQLVARFFDHVFLYHRNYLPAFNEHPQGHVHWLPYACDLEFFKPLGVERDLDVAFIGQNIPGSGRGALLARLSKHYKMNEQRYYLQEEIPPVYSRAKMVLNLPLADDLNFRFFEALSCGAMLLTRRIDNGQEVLFQEGKHFVAFSDEKELFGQIDYYLSHPLERQAIAAAGLEEVRQNHRLEQRIVSLLDTIGSNPGFAAPIRRMTPGQIDRQYALLYEYWRAIGPGLQRMRAARRAGRAWLPLLLPAVRTFLRLTLR